MERRLWQPLELVSYWTQEADCSSLSRNKYLKLLIGSAAFGPAYYNIPEIKHSRFAFHLGKVRAPRTSLMISSPLPSLSGTKPFLRLGLCSRELIANLCFHCLTVCKGLFHICLSFLPTEAVTWGWGSHLPFYSSHLILKPSRVVLDGTDNHSLLLN